MYLVHLGAIKMLTLNILSQRNFMLYAITHQPSSHKCILCALNIKHKEDFEY